MNLILIATLTQKKYQESKVRFRTLKERKVGSRGENFYGWFCKTFSMTAVSSMVMTIWKEGKFGLSSFILLYVYRNKILVPPWMLETLLYKKLKRSFCAKKNSPFILKSIYAKISRRGRKVYDKENILQIEGSLVKRSHGEGVGYL